MVHKSESGEKLPPPPESRSSAGEDGSRREAPPPRSRAGWRRLRHVLRILVPVAVIALVWRELSVVDWRQAYLEIRTASLAPIAWALMATLACVSNMGLYDVLSLRTGSRLSAFERWRLGTAICSWTNFLAVGPLAGPALRLHFYRRAGMDLGRVLRGLAGIYAGMFSGIAGWIAAVFVTLPDAADTALVRVSIALFAGPLLCVALGALIRRVRRDLADEDLSTYVALGIIGAVEWGLVVLVFALIGHAIGSDDSFLSMAHTFLAGHVAGAASLLPGGLGSADAVWLEMNLSHGSSAGTAAAHVLLFRCVYFLWPWALSILALLGFLAMRAARTGESGLSRRADSTTSPQTETHTRDVRS